jgi:hypothetical protein
VVEAQLQPPGKWTKQQRLHLTFDSPLPADVVKKVPDPTGKKMQPLQGHMIVANVVPRPRAPATKNRIFNTTSLGDTNPP